MANNVFEQTKGQEVHLASNQIVCKVLESLMSFVEPAQLESYFKAFADNFRPICSDRFASHVLQKMVEVAFLRSVTKEQFKASKEAGGEEDENGPPSNKKAKPNDKNTISEERYNLDTEFPEEHRKNCSNFVLRVGKFMLNNLEEFVWDSCANHIMRTCIFSLSGIHVPKVPFEKAGTDIGKNKKLYEVSEESKEISKEFAQRLEMWPQFSDFPYQEHSSALLCALVISLKVIDKNMLKHFGKQILMQGLLKVEESGDNKEEKIEIEDEEESPQKEEHNEDVQQQSTEVIPKLPKVFHYQCSVVLLETLLSVAGPKLLTQLYAMLFTGKMAMLAKEPLTNFAVQKLLQNIKEKEDFENVFEELHEHIEELLKIGHTGVVSSLSAACLRLQTKQGQLISALQSALHVSGDKEKMKSFFLCLIKLKPFEILKDDKTSSVHLHGSLIIQDILRFNKPIFMVNCLLETSPEYIVSIFNTPNGSHICDAFLQSKFIGEKSREKLIKILEGFYVDLATTRNGSRVVESCFAAALEPQKAKIVKELSEKLNMLKGTPFGNFVNDKLRVETYRLSADQWKAGLHKKESKAQKLFKDLIN